MNMFFNKVNDKSYRSDSIKRFPQDTYLKISNFFKAERIERREVVIVCIGTNRTNTIDCLGPYVGSLLKEDKEFNIPVYGSMVKPINALNLTESITEVRNLHPNSVIIAVDAALSMDNKIGQIKVNDSPIMPGSGVNKELFAVGDFSIRGYVGPNGINIVEYGADLSFISAMAYTIAKGLKEVFA